MSLYLVHILAQHRNTTAIIFYSAVGITQNTSFINFNKILATTIVDKINKIKAVLSSFFKHGQGSEGCKRRPGKERLKFASDTIFSARTTK